MAESSRRGFDETSLVPENAPFDEEQRAWLNGFLAGLLGLSDTGETALPVRPPEASTPEGLTPQEQRVRLAESQVAAARGEGLRAGRAEAGSLRVAPAAPASGGRRPGPTTRVAVQSSRGLIQGDEGVEVAEVVFDLQSAGLTYHLGDTIAVVPTNDLDLVRLLLRAMGARGQEIVAARTGAREAWRCLLEDTDVTHLRDETLAVFASASKSDSESRLIADLPVDVRSELDLLDLLERFPGVRPGIERIVASLPPLSPRLYAIASSPSVHPGHAHVLVRALRRERGQRERKGVASTLLAEGVFKGDELTVNVSPGERMALPGDAPLVFVASGVGLGRFKGLLEELSHRGRSGGTWLVYAARSSGEEGLYDKEISSFRRSGVLEHFDVVRAAPRGRRSGPREVLRKRARRLSTWLSQGAHVYFSGELWGETPVLSDVILDVLCRHARMSRPHAEGYLLSMRREGRFLEEVY